MGRASNSLKTSDVITTPIKLKYSSSYASGSYEQYGIEVYIGVNEPVTSSFEYTHEGLTYRSIRNLYYSNHLTSSYLGWASSSKADNWLQSTAASGTLETDQRSFPTGSYDLVPILSIPRQVFGEKIARRSFTFKTQFCYLYDDGNGNVWDLLTVPPYIRALYFNSPDEYFVTVRERGVHVGNIIYAQGIVTITNPEYRTVFAGGFLLQEDANYLLMEDGGLIRLQ